MTIVRRLDVQFLFALFCICFFVACGGGGGDTPAVSPTPVATNATITGTVAGTTIVAYNATTGAEVARSVASGTPKRFTLSLPTGISYKIYLLENEGTENERVYPLYLFEGETNVFEINAIVDIELGFVDTTTGVAVPENDLTSEPGVTPGDESPEVPSDISASAFSLADLSGTWNFHGLWAGSSAGWYYGAASISSEGAATYPNQTIASTGPRTSVPHDLSITSAGIVTVPVSNPSYWHGLMTFDKSLMIGTRFLSETEYTFQFWQKSGGTFATADLAGTWNFHGIWAGSSAGWYHGAASISSDGAVTYPNQTIASNGPRTSDSHDLSITPAGIVTVPVNNPSYWHGVMSSDKSLMISTRSVSSTAYTLQIWQKHNPEVTYSAADAQGTWKFRAMTTGTDSTWQGWMLGRATIAGNSMTVSDIVTRSGSNNPFTINLNMTSDGIATSTTEGFESLHAVMSSDKKMIVVTQSVLNNETTEHTMIILQR